VRHPAGGGELLDQPRPVRVRHAVDAWFERDGT
jgi:hypothetical protein